VERYKSLLLKQRDIMIALTQRLNERDEQILGLQAELEAYDTHQRWAALACGGAGIHLWVHGCGLQGALGVSCELLMVPPCIPHQ
jgi:hypothetical protein